MKTNYLRRFAAFTISMLICITSVLYFYDKKVSASTENLDGMLYVYGEKSEFQLSGFSTAVYTATNTTEHQPIGILSITGEFTQIANHNGIKSYIVNSNNIDIKYKFDTSRLSSDSNKTEWHLTKDKAKTVNGVDLGGKNKSGAILVQSSFDGSNWCDDVILTNQFTKKASSEKDLYSTNDVQLLNGCYYRIVIAYKMEKKVGSSLTIAGHDLKDKKAYERIEEVYEFYAENKDKVDESIRKHDENDYYFDDFIGTDDEYYKERDINLKDPHYGEKIGGFAVKGFTSFDKSSDIIKFEKTGNDRIAITFDLYQDNINKLFGNKDLKINNDTANDKSLQIKNQKFKQGALIINFTTTNNQKKDPIIYTNFLAACTTTKANTAVYLFEEGKYDITLDYEILDISKTPDKKTNYKIHFQFEVSNGNSKVFFKDSTNATFLNNNDITENGFTLDFANSKKLKANVEYYKYTMNDSNQLSESLVQNSSAADGDKFTKSGKYVITITADTGTESVFTLYVTSSDDKYALAVTREGCDLAEVNRKLKEGYKINSDGTMTK